MKAHEETGFPVWFTRKVDEKCYYFSQKLIDELIMNGDDVWEDCRAGGLDYFFQFDKINNTIKYRFDYTFKRKNSNFEKIKTDILNGFKNVISVSLDPVITEDEHNKGLYVQNVIVNIDLSKEIA